MPEVPSVPGPLCHGLAVDVLSQTIPHPMGAKYFFPVFEGFLAWAALLTIAVAFLTTRRISFFFLLLVVILSTILSEGILGHFGTVELQTRPPGNCIGKNGWPSGHTQQLMTAFTYLFFDTLFRPGWSVGKKIGLIITYLLIFIPNGPSRWAVQDHKWVQIGSGYGIGFGVGLIGFLLIFLVARRFLEDIFALKIVRKLRLVNDYEPNYEHSRHKGTKMNEIKKKEVNATPNTNFVSSTWNHITGFGPAKWETLKAWQFVLILSPVPIIFFVMGAIGVAASYWKENQSPDCEVAAPEVMRATGSMTLFTGLFICILIAFGVYRMGAKGPQKHLINQYLWLFVCFLVIEDYIWNYASWVANHRNIISLENDGDTCPPAGQRDVGLDFVIAWFIVITIALFYFCVVWYIFRFMTLYTNRLEMWPANRGSGAAAVQSTGRPTPGNPNERPPLGHPVNRPDLQDQRTTSNMVGTPVTQRSGFVPQQV